MRATALLTCLLLAVSLVGARENSPEPGGKGEGRVSIWKQLDLSSEQSAALRSLRKEQMTEIRTLGKALRATRAVIKEELLKQSPDQGVLNRAATEAGDLSEKLTASFINHLLEVKKVLTPEQFATVLEHDTLLRFGGASMATKSTNACKSHYVKSCCSGKNQTDCPKRGSHAQCPHHKGAKAP